MEPQLGSEDNKKKGNGKNKFSRIYTCCIQRENLRGG